MTAVNRTDATVKSFHGLPLRAVVVWLVLVALTVTNPLLGSEGAGSHWAVAILTIAVVKVRFVGLDFMELRSAPTAMRLVFEAYCLVLWAVLAACFLWL